MSLTEEELIQDRIAEREARRIGKLRELNKENSGMKQKSYSPTVPDTTPLDLQSVFSIDIDEPRITASNSEVKSDPIPTSPNNKKILSLSNYPIGSLYKKGVEQGSSSLTQEEEGNREEDKENKIIVLKPPKQTFTQSLKKWFTPRKGGKKNKKPTKSIRLTKHVRLIKRKKRRSSRK
jgi:hypothetical protein